MIIAIARAHAAVGRRDRLTDLMTHVAAASRLENGCREYSFLADIDDADILVSLEIWESPEALNAHMAKAHTQHFLEQIGELLVGPPEVTFHTTLDRG